MTHQQSLFTGSIDVDESGGVELIRRKMREWVDEYPRYAVFGPSQYFCADAGITLYKTARNALNAAGDCGVLVHMDFEQLRIVDASEKLVTKGKSRNEIGDVEFCERQAILWMQRADRLRGRR